MATLSHNFGPATVSGELAWSPDYFAESGDAVWLKGGVTVPITDKFAFMDALSVSANIAYDWIDDNVTFGAPGEYALHLNVDDFSGRGSGETGCCWTTAIIKVSVTP